MLPVCSTPTPSVQVVRACALGLPSRRFTVHTSICFADTLVIAIVSDTNTSVLARCAPTIASTRYSPGFCRPIGIITLPGIGLMNSLLEPVSFTPAGGAIGLA